MLNRHDVSGNKIHHDLPSLDLSDHRILVVEDNPVNMRLMRIILENGAELIPAVNGKALDVLLHNRLPDLVLMDVSMPVLDGLAATTQYRSQEAVDVHVPIVALTANALGGDRERCLEAGMDAFLSKPLRQEELFGTLKQYLFHEDTRDHAPDNTGVVADVVEDQRELSVGEIDQECWQLVHGMSPADQVELLVDFIRQIEGILTLHQRSDVSPDELSREAHLVKGAARSIGLLSLAEALQLLEFAGEDRQKRNEGWSQLLSNVVAAKKFLQLHITNLRDESTSS